MLEFMFFQKTKLQVDFEHYSNDVHIYVFPFLKLQTHFKKTRT